MTTGSPKRPALGRGLSTLFPQATPATSGPEGAPTAPLDPAPAGPGPGAPRVVMLPLESLRPGSQQPRTQFDEVAIVELSESLRAHGMLQPILARRSADGHGWEIVAGERRWRAAQRVPMHLVPVVIQALDDRAALEIGLIENIQRADLNPLDEAEAYRRLMESFGHSQDELARIVGKSRAHISNLVRVLRLPPEVRDWVAKGMLSVGHAKALAGHPEAGDLAREVVEKGLTVRQTERLAANGAGPPSARLPAARKAAPEPVPETAPPDADTDALRQDLEDRLGLPVELSVDRRNQAAGRLTIAWRTLDELDQLLRLLTHGG